MLTDNGIRDVQVICVEGQLTDHYNPVDKTVNLSEAVYNERNAAAAAVAVACGDGGLVADGVVGGGADHTQGAVVGLDDFLRRLPVRSPLDRQLVVDGPVDLGAEAHARQAVGPRVPQAHPAAAQRRIDTGARIVDKASSRFLQRLDVPVSYQLAPVEAERLLKLSTPAAPEAEAPPAP